MNKESLLLYAITDKSWLEGKTLTEQVKEALEGGVTMVQYRQKKNPSIEEALSLRALCHSYKVPFIINDYVDLAKEIDADGVHVGLSDMAVAAAREALGPDKIIGATAKTVTQALAAQNAGADYLGSGAVFGSSTKRDAIPMDIGLFKEICHSVKIPVVAIGGIDENKAMELAKTGLAGIAVVSGIFAQPDIKQASAHLKEVAKRLL